MKAILADEAKIVDIIRTEILELKERFNDTLHTEITSGGLEMIEDEDLIPVENKFLPIFKSTLPNRMFFASSHLIIIPIYKLHTSHH